MFDREIRKLRRENEELRLKAQSVDHAMRRILRLRDQRDEARGDRAVPGIFALGYALFYTLYLHSDIDLGDQVDRIHTLCERWVDLRKRELRALRLESKNMDMSEEEFEAFRTQQMEEHRAMMLKGHPEADTNGDGTPSEEAISL